MELSAWDDLNRYTGMNTLRSILEQEKGELSRHPKMVLLRVFLNRKLLSAHIDDEYEVNIELWTNAF
jgi:hypothetical protein